MTRYILALLFLLWTIPSPAHAAVSCSDAGAQEYYQATPIDPENRSPNYTPPSTANRITLSFFGQRRGGGALAVTETIGGTSGTQVGSTGYQDPAGATAWYYTNLAASSLAVVVDPAGTPLAEAIITLSCTGVNTVADGASGTPFRSFDVQQGSSTSAACTPGTVQTGDVTVFFAFKDGSATFTGNGANQTSIKAGGDGAESAATASWKDGVNGAAMTASLVTEQWACVAMVLRPENTARHLQMYAIE